MVVLEKVTNTQANTHLLPIWQTREKVPSQMHTNKKTFSVLDSKKENLMHVSKYNMFKRNGIVHFAFKKYIFWD